MKGAKARKKKLETREAKRLADLKKNAAKKPCGNRGKYVGGCRCDKCREANKLYQRQLTKRQLREGSILVDAEPVKQHIQMLRAKGIGLKTIAERAGMDINALKRIIDYRKRMRKSTAEILLALPVVYKAGHYIPDHKIRAMVDTMVKEGFTRARIMRLAKTQLPFYKAKSKKIRVLTAARISAVFKKYVAED